MLKISGTSKCACGEHKTHMLLVQHVHEIEVLDAHSGLSDIGIWCSQHMLAFISIFDRTRLHLEELERHYVQHGCENQKHGV